MQVAQLRPSRHGPSPQNDTPHSRRRLLLNDYETGDIIDDEDEIRLLIDPTSAYAQSMGFALGRTMDEVIIAAIEGDALAIDPQDTASTVPAKFFVDKDFGTADSNLTFEKVVQAKRILLENEVMEEEDFTFAIDADAAHNLLQQTEISSVDFNSVRVLVNGKMNTFMGFNFIPLQRLNKNAEGSVNCLAYAGSGVGLGIGRDVQILIGQDPSISFSTRVIGKMSIAATRIEEEKVVIVESVPTPVTATILAAQQAQVVRFTEANKQIEARKEAAAKKGAKKAPVETKKEVK